MLAVVESGLCTWRDLRTDTTLEDLGRMYVHLKKKADAARQQQQQASARAAVRQAFG